MCIFSSIIPRQFNYYFSSRPYFGLQIDGIFGYTSDGQLVLETNLNKFLLVMMVQPLELGTIPVLAYMKLNSNDKGS